MNPLFTVGNFSSIREANINSMKSEVASFDHDYLLGTNEDELTQYLNNKYSFDRLELSPDNIEIIDKGESVERVSDYGRTINIKKTTITIALPFSGDSKFFGLRASAYDSAPPYGLVQENELRFRFSIDNANPELIKREIDKVVSSVQQYVKWMNNDIDSSNTHIKKEIALSISRNKEKVLKDRGTVESLGIPIRTRENAPQTYRVPVVRKKIQIEKPKTSGKHHQPDPVIDYATYQNILDIIRNMVYVIERSPRAFENMGEEELRDHFLVQLNGQFEGEATGETFNFTGKTDILIKSNGRNIFIAECKFWSGPSNFSKTIDQLLSYLSWRDTKTAILIFNRNKNMSSVLEKIPDEIKNHSNYKGSLETTRETEFTCALKSTNDEQRELLLTVMVFDVPSSNKALNPDAAKDAAQVS